MAPIRCGGVPTSYTKQLLVVGDAAGHVDPLTGGHYDMVDSVIVLRLMLSVVDPLYG